MATAEFDILDPRFKTRVKTSASVEKLWTGGRWTEGPAYFPALKSLVFSDIPNDRLMRFDETTGQTGILCGGRDRYVNGNTVDRQGRLVSCEHGGRCVTRTEHDGRLTVLADRFDGKRFNSPNDLVVKSDDSIWFTDPAYGIDSDYEGFAATPELDGCHVYRIDGQTGHITKVTDDFERPNGLAFSPNETKLYIVDSGGTHFDSGEHHIRVFDVRDDNTLSGGDVLAECENGFFDGFRLDQDGRLWCAAADGVHCLLPNGELIGKVLLPERASNVCFGGPKNNRLFVTASGSLYAILLPTTGHRTF